MRRQSACRNWEQEQSSILGWGGTPPFSSFDPRGGSCVQGQAGMPQPSPLLWQAQHCLTCSLSAALLWGHAAPCWQHWQNTVQGQSQGYLGVPSWPKLAPGLETSGPQGTDHRSPAHKHSQTAGGGRSRTAWHTVTFIEWTDMNEGTHLKHSDDDQEQTLNQTRHLLSRS